jgi:hypothetical protein
MATLSWTTTVQVTGAPAVTLSAPPKPLEAQDYVETALEPGDADVPVAVQPGAGARVRLLAVVADRYGPELTFKVSDGAADSAAIALDEPQLFARSGIGLLGLDPKLLRLSNASPDKPALVKVYVFRDAAP